MSGGDALPAMPMSMPTMPMTMEVTRGDTEAAISHRTLLRPPSVPVGPSVGPAIGARPETHRHHADGRGAHQRQDDTARTFHVAVPRRFKANGDHLSFGGDEASQSRCSHRIVREVAGIQPPPEKCDVKACANEPKPPRVTPPEPESDEAPDEEWLPPSPLKKLLRDDPPLPLDEEPRGGHSAPACRPDGAATPDGTGAQFSPGISA